MTLIQHKDPVKVFLFAPYGTCQVTSHSNIVASHELYYAVTMRIFLLIISFFCLAAAVAAKDVYRFVDEQGNVIYSDTPVPGAEKIRIDEVQTIDPGEVPQFVYTPPPTEVPAYTKLEIVSPENDSVIRSHEGTVTISASVEPVLNLRVGHHLVLYLDGNEGASANSPQFNLSDVESGSHSASVAIVDKDGTEIMHSPSVSFTLQRESFVEPSSTARQMPTAKEAADPEKILEEGPRGFTPRQMPTAEEAANPEWIKEHGPHGFTPRQLPPAPPPEGP